ncbi:MAG: hypothetical protein U1B83_08010, partial [Candidatus Cloacimonadaceae bacterium]|nr:hypothetical protein [Candidatus Cloacimonadaceae bacterium]
SFLAGADWMEGTWMGSVYNPASWWTVNPQTGAGTRLAFTDRTMHGLAYDEVNNIIYGTDSYSLYTINPNTGAQTLIGPFMAGGWPGSMIGLAYDSYDATLYGVDVGFDALLEIDTATGLAYGIGYLGIDLLFAQDIALDRDTGWLYLAAYTGSGALYWIHTQNGSAWKIGDFPGGVEVTGFAIPYGGLDVPYVSIGTDGTLSWHAVSGATGYNVYGADDPYGGFTLLGSTTATIWTDPGFSTTRKFYQVTASNTLPIASRTQLPGVEYIPARQARSMDLMPGVSSPRTK